MQSLIDLYKHSKTLHHAYFVVSHKVDEAYSKLKDFFEEHVGVKTDGNPDFWYGKFDSLTIDDARAIAESSERKDFSGDRKVFIIQADFISIEAQNSLLKVFEEPTIGTHFFIISPQDMLLPTLRSRMQVVFHTSESDESQSILKLKLKDRLSLVKQITDGISDEEKTKQDAITLLNQVELELYEKGAEKSRTALGLCQEARASLYDRGAPVKMILENLLLNV